MQIKCAKLIPKMLLFSDVQSSNLGFIDDDGDGDNEIRGWRGGDETSEMKTFQPL